MSRSMLWFALQRLVDLGEELVVVVDVLGVLDRDPGGRLEVGHRLLVDVERPVGDPERLLPALAAAGGRVAAGAAARLPCRCRRRPAGCRRAPGRPPPSADRRRNCAAADAPGGATAADHRLAASRFASAHGTLLRRYRTMVGQRDGGSPARSCAAGRPRRRSAPAPAAGGSSRAASVSQLTQRPQPGPERRAAAAPGSTWADDLGAVGARAACSARPGPGRPRARRRRRDAAAARGLACREPQALGPDHDGRRGAGARRPAAVRAPATRGARPRSTGARRRRGPGDRRRQQVGDADEAGDEHRCRASGRSPAACRSARRAPRSSPRCGPTS